jgi:hypothetical protein
MKDKALKLALEALEEVHRTGDTQVFDMYYAEPAIAAIKEALAETDSDAIETLVYMAGLRDGKKMEREACAKVCEDSVEYAGDTLAEAIRERGQA